MDLKSTRFRKSALDGSCRRCGAVLLAEIRPGRRRQLCEPCRVYVNQHGPKTPEHCRFCGIEFVPDRKSRGVYCSTAHHNEAIRPPKHVCRHCGNEFEPPYRGALAAAAIYCGNPCVWAAAAKRQERTCEGCGIVFRARLYKARPATRRWFHSRACFFAWHRKGFDRPLLRRMSEGKRKARKLANAILPVDYREIIARDRYKCWLCGKRIPPADLHFDHAVPLHWDGEHSTRNIRMAHSKCNIRKSAKLVTHQPFLI